MKKCSLKFFFSIFLICGLLSVSGPVLAAETIKDLRNQVKALQQRIEQLETQQANQNAGPPARYYYPRRQTWDPFDEIRRMQEEMNRMVQSSFGTRGWSNGGVFSNNLSFDHDVDVEEKKDVYLIKFDMANLDENKVQVDINDHAITVKGEYSASNEEQRQGGFVSASSYGSFMKTVPIPEDADASKMKTEKEDSMLIITLPKM